MTLRTPNANFLYSCTPSLSLWRTVFALEQPALGFLKVEKSLEGIDILGGNWHGLRTGTWGRGWWEVGKRESFCASL